MTEHGTVICFVTGSTFPNERAWHGACLVKAA